MINVENLKKDVDRKDLNCFVIYSYKSYSNLLTKSFMFSQI